VQFRRTDAAQTWPWRLKRKRLRLYGVPIIGTAGPNRSTPSRRTAARFGRLLDELKIPQAQETARRLFQEEAGPRRIGNRFSLCWFGPSYVLGGRPPMVIAYDLNTVAGVTSPRLH